MLSCRQTPSTPMKIPVVASTTSTHTEYSLKLNSFDPFKSSPPNEFMLKLRMRMNNYATSRLSLDSKDDSLVSE